MSNDIPPPVRDEPAFDADAPVGSATMLADGTLHLSLRAATPDGTIGESLMVVGPADPRYADIVAHLGGIGPGEHRPIPPFPAPEIDVDAL